MILGNPYKFAVFIKVIQEWNIDETFGNGVLLFGIDGSIFPSKILTTALNCEINPLKEKLENVAINNEIYDMKKEAAFKQIYDITFPEDVSRDNDYQFDITPLSFTEDSCYIFAVSNGYQVRILAAKLEYDKEESRHILLNASISEALISVQELKQISRELKVVL